jgi:hypothetical protein
MCVLNLKEILYSPAPFWLAMYLINSFIFYRYYNLSKIEEETYSQIKKAFGEESLYIYRGDIVVLENESEAESCVELGNFMLSSSKTNKCGFLLAAIGALLAAIAAFVSILQAVP